jgi:hypothetical protein
VEDRGEGEREDWKEIDFYIPDTAFLGDIRLERMKEELKSAKLQIEQEMATRKQVELKMESMKMAAVSGGASGKSSTSTDDNGTLIISPSYSRNFINFNSYFSVKRKKRREVQTCWKVASSGNLFDQFSNLKNLKPLLQRMV